MRYDSPNCTVRREAFGGEAGGAATTEYAKYRFFQKAKLKAVHFVRTTAGTATAHGFNIFRGTASVGAVALNTTTAAASAGGEIASATGLDLTIAAGQQLSVKSLADAVGKAHVIYEYEVLPDAVESA